MHNIKDNSCLVSDKYDVYFISKNNGDIVNIKNDATSMVYSPIFSRVGFARDFINSHSNDKLFEGAKIFKGHLLPQGQVAT